MSTYRINTENTGLDTDAKARRMAEILASAGYDVEFTRDFGLVNPTASCPCTDAEWEAALIQADAEA
jgi:hypothetical protein